MIDDAELRACLEVLEKARGLDPDDPTYVALERAAAHLAKTAKKKRRRSRRQARAEHNHAVLSTAARTAAHFEAPEADVGSRLIGTRNCYVCKQRFDQVDRHYHALCPRCAGDHKTRRELRVDLAGRRALVTGGRIKIGFETALRLLRDGAEVTVTTRFPADALARYRALPDWSDVGDRLRVVGLDFRDVRGLIGWIEAEATGAPLDILINNAAQTIRRRPAYYAALARVELAQLEAGRELAIAESARDALVGFHRAAAGETDIAFPPGRFDVEGLQLDLSEQNSWTRSLAEVGPAELLETHLVTAVAPFLLCAGLKPCLERSPFADRYIVNASAMEGVFNYPQKTHRHPHTNMAKAALNMLTRTSAADYATSGIYMVSVDTGWITDENPEEVRQRSKFCPPLDVIDGASRLFAPIASGVAGAPLHGVFLKDYEVAPW